MKFGVKESKANVRNQKKRIMHGEVKRVTMEFKKKSKNIYIYIYKNKIKWIKINQLNSFLDYLSVQLEFAMYILIDSFYIITSK